MNVRLADRVLIPALAHGLVDLHAEAPLLRDRPLDEARILRGLEVLVDAGTAVVAQHEDGPLAGFLLFTMGEEWWSGETIACELALYVAPAWRGRFLAGRLVGAAEARAAHLGAADFRSGTTTGTATEATCVVYARAGFEQTGRVFRKRLGLVAPDAATLGSRVS